MLFRYVLMSKKIYSNLVKFYFVLIIFFRDFVDEITIDDTNTPTITPKNVNSAMKSTPACWTSAVLEDCRMTLRKDTECDTPQQVLNANNATRNFNINTKTIVMNMPIIPNKQVISMLKQVFNRLCVEFVRDNCKNNCKQLHEFPSADVVRQNMTNVNLTIIENAYEFMKNYPKMFLMYFPVFCDVFSFFKLPNRLKAMFLDCERQTRTIDYYRHVVAGLTKTGMLKYKSIWMCIQNTTDSPYARETITNMIAETGPDVVRFVDYLKHCGTLPMPMFNKILEQCVTYQNPDLQYYLFSSFQQSLQHQTVVSQVNQSNMIKFIQLIKRSQQFNTEKMEENLVHVLEKVCCI